MEEKSLDYFKQQLALMNFESVQTEYSESELIDNELFDVQVSFSKDIYDRLGPLEKWREHIDGRHQYLGRTVYQEGLHRGGKNKDPLYNAQLLEADRYVASTIGKDFGVKEYDHVHRLVTGGSAFERSVRKESTRFTYDKLLASPTDLMMEDSYIKSIKTTSVNGIEKEAVIEIAPVEDAMGEVDRLLRNYKKRMKELRQRGLDTPDNLLREIVFTHKKLENLHPHIDYNTRTHRLILNRMLAENRLPLTILESPLDVSRTRFSSWVEEIKKGQNEWLKRAIKVPKEKAQKDWKFFSFFEENYDYDRIIKSIESLDL